MTLDDPTAVRPTFPVGLFTEDQTMGFELTVRDRFEPAYLDQDTVRVTVRDLNDPPITEADTGGNGYEVPEGGEATLAGSATDPDGNITTVAWDFDDDGDFDDATGQTPVFYAAGLDGPNEVTVALRAAFTTWPTPWTTAMEATAPAPSRSEFPTTSAGRYPWTRGRCTTRL